VVLQTLEKKSYYALGTMVAGGDHRRYIFIEPNLQGGDFPVLKKLITTAIMASTFALTIPLAATTVEGQTRYCTCRTTRHRSTHRRTTTRRSSYANSYASTRYSNGYYVERKPNVYQRHRRLFNTAIGAGAGALIGGLLGGRRGAGIGILAGAGGSQVFTHYQRPTNYRRVYRP
jgi:hypothetical protein